VRRETWTYDGGYDECWRLIRLKKKHEKAAHWEAKDKINGGDNVHWLERKRKKINYYLLLLLLLLFIIIVAVALCVHCSAVSEWKVPIISLSNILSTSIHQYLHSIFLHLIKLTYTNHFLGFHILLIQLTKI